MDKRRGTPRRLDSGLGVRYPDDAFVYQTFDRDTVGEAITGAVRKSTFRAATSHERSHQQIRRNEAGPAYACGNRIPVHGRRRASRDHGWLCAQLYRCARASRRRHQPLTSESQNVAGVRPR